MYGAAQLSENRIVTVLNQYFSNLLTICTLDQSSGKIDIMVDSDYDEEDEDDGGME